MQNYNPQRIEKKWQRIWDKKGTFEAKDNSKKPKFYILVEFPYPSGEGLHVGHCRSYIAMDILARKRRMEGFNVLFPMGWDAFGLPTENYAIRTGIAPTLATKKSTDNFRRQEKSLGLSFDWNREINTANPKYYKWTQWIFLRLFEKGLAYKKKMAVNWCPSCKIVLANEEVVEGKCERCGTKSGKKEKEQWLLKITKYADRLIDDLDKVDYPERIKIQQKEWIGRSEGVIIDFKVQGSKLKIPVFTTRPDTLFGCTYLVLAPEHPIIERLKFQISNYKDVKRYIEKSKKKTERERVSKMREKSGIELKGVKALNPANNEEIPIFIADYVLIDYGEGAIMAVPAHDSRDFEFAQKHNLPIKMVICPNYPKPICPILDNAYEQEGYLVNSGRFEGMNSEKAKEEITKFVGGKKAVNYKLRDWIFSRQRYWGEPIPLVFCSVCKKRIQDSKSKTTNSKINKGELLNPGWVAVFDKDLPVKLPKVEDYKPTEKGDSPLAKVKNWVNVKCPKCKSPAKRETDVMPNWAGSNWYYLRYCDPRNDKTLADPKKVKYWLGPVPRQKIGGVDWYNGGMEHVTLHLLYSRFIFKFLWDIGVVPKEVGPEPYKKRTAHGVVLGEDGMKMSKSRGNIINPDEVVKQFGADAMRLYIMFMGPFEQMIPWDTKGLIGARRFLEKVWRLGNQVGPKRSSVDLRKELSKTIKKVSEHIEVLKFNTAVSALMEFSNTWQKDAKGLDKENLKEFLKILSPFAPHLAEELWERAGFGGFCFQQKWPKIDSKLIEEEKFPLIIQVNGKFRDKIEVNRVISQKEAEKLALSREKVRKWISGKKVKKIIFVKGKLINIVI